MLDCAWDVTTDRRKTNHKTVLNANNETANIPFFFKEKALSISNALVSEAGPMRCQHGQVVRHALIMISIDRNVFCVVNYLLLTAWSHQDFGAVLNLHLMSGVKSWVVEPDHLGSGMLNHAGQRSVTNAGDLNSAGAETLINTTARRRWLHQKHRHAHMETSRDQQTLNTHLLHEKPYAHIH